MYGWNYWFCRRCCGCAGGVGGTMGDITGGGWGAGSPPSAIDIYGVDHVTRNELNSISN